MPRQPSGEAQTVAQRVQRHRRAQIAELARLRAEVERLRAVLEEIAEEELDEGDPDPTEPTFGARYYIGLAREALKQA